MCLQYLRSKHMKNGIVFLMDSYKVKQKSMKTRAGIQGMRSEFVIQNYYERTVPPKYMPSATNNSVVLESSKRRHVTFQSDRIVREVPCKHTLLHRKTRYVTFSIS